MKAPRFEVYKTETGWRWRLKAGNGEIQCPSEGYATRAGAIRGVEAMCRNAAKAKVCVLD